MKPKRWRRQAARRKKDAPAERNVLSEYVLSDELQEAALGMHSLTDAAQEQYGLSPEAKLLYLQCIALLPGGLQPGKPTVWDREKDYLAAEQELLSHELVYREDGVLYAVHEFDGKGSVLFPVEAPRPFLVKK